MPMTKRDAERLSREQGARFLKHGSNHDIWQAPSGKKYQIPRHSKDLTTGVEASILKALGLK